MKIVILSLLFAVFTSCGSSPRPAQPNTQACTQPVYRKIDLPGSSTQIITSTAFTTIAFSEPSPAQLDAGALGKLVDCLQAADCGRALQPAEMASLRQRVQRSAPELVDLAGQRLEITRDGLGTLIVMDGRADLPKVLGNLFSGVQGAPCMPPPEQPQCPGGTNPGPRDAILIPVIPPGCSGPAS